MDIRNWNGKKKVIALAVVLLLIVGIVVTILLVQMRQDTRTRAEKATVLSLSPGSQTVQVGDQVNLDVEIDPGVNQVDFVKMVINFDPQKFDTTSTTFNINPTSVFKTTAEPVITEGQIVITLDIGSNPTDVIRTPQTIGTLGLRVLTTDEVVDVTTLSGETQVAFLDAQTEIRSIGSTDTAYENVLSSTNPATILIEAVCRPDIATCDWDAAVDAVSYNYVIRNTDEDEIVAEGNTTEVSVEFPVLAGVNYSCDVEAVNECGEGTPSSAIGVCGDVVATPTPEPTGEPSATPTAEPTATATPDPTATSTPAPTDVPDATSTPVPTNLPEAEPTSTPTPTVAVAEATPTPLPPTGNPLIMVGSAIGGVLIILGGLALLML